MAPRSASEPHPVLSWALGALLAVVPGMSLSASAVAPHPAVQSMIAEHCVDCHDPEARKGDLDLSQVTSGDVLENAPVWEQVLRKLRARQMPPPRKRRPPEQEYAEVITWLSDTLDREAARRPRPGRTETFRRLNRTEYQNAVRDLLDLHVDVEALLPKDDVSHGFDNLAVHGLSPTLLNRYLLAAEKISRWALGRPERQPGGATYRTRPDLTQEHRIEDLPPGTRGGLRAHHYFPRNGEYEIAIRLARDRNEEVEGLRGQHDIEVSLDRARVGLLTVAPPGADRNFQKVDEHLKVRLPVEAGSRVVDVTFLKDPTPLLETRRQPYQARFNYHRHPRQTPAIYQVSIHGPFEATGPGDTPSRRRILVRYPAGAHEEDACAEEIFRALTRRAYRRPTTPADLEKPIAFYRAARATGDFESGIESGLRSILMSPEFLFRIELDPPGSRPGTVYRVDGRTLASRLSFFLWSSIPDEELLRLAERDELHRPEALERQVRRMLADPRARSLVTSFAEQWLHVRNLDSITPDLRLFPDFDDNLRQAFRRETGLFVAEVFREDRSVLDLLGAEHGYLNERLARHYGVPHVHGSRFRRVPLPAGSVRGGLLRQGSILTVTSYATRTSPVLRGKWVLENILGTPPPPPLPDVPALEENSVSSTRSVRQRLAEHRAHAACASCHDAMDPVGLAFENFDAVGRWRTLEDGLPIDATGGLPDGTTSVGIQGLESGLLQRPEQFVGTLTEKLLTYALGRRLEFHDQPSVRSIVRQAALEDYRFSSIILAIAQSPPFTMRESQ